MRSGVRDGEKPVVNNRHSGLYKIFHPSRCFWMGLFAMVQVQVSRGFLLLLQGLFPLPTPPDSALLREDPERVELTVVHPGSSHSLRISLALTSLNFTSWFSPKLVGSANMVFSGEGVAEVFPDCPLVLAQADPQYTRTHGAALYLWFLPGVSAVH